MKDETNGVDRLAQQLLGTTLIKLRQSRVRQHHIPMPIDREGGKRAMGPQYAFDGALGGLQFVHRTLGKGRGESGGKQQRIAISKRNIQILGKAADHLPAWLGLAGLEI